MWVSKWDEVVGESSECGRLRDGGRWWRKRGRSGNYWQMAEFIQNLINLIWSYFLHLGKWDICVRRECDTLHPCVAEHLRPAQDFFGGGPAAQSPGVVTAGRLTITSSLDIIDNTALRMWGCHHVMVHLLGSILPPSHLSPAVLGASAAPWAVK